MSKNKRVQKLFMAVLDSDEDSSQMLEEEAEDESDNPEDDSDIYKNDGDKATANHDRLDQVRISDMEAEVSALRRQLSELKNRKKNVSPEPAERPASKNTKCMVNGYDKKAVDKIRQLGGKFTIMYSLWIANAQNSLSEWYTGRRQGEHADLLEVFPDEYHNNLTGDFIHPIRIVHSNTSRSKDIWIPARRRTLIGWKQDADGQVYYTLFAPILYRDYKDRPDIHNILLNQALFDVFSVIICGPSALDRKPDAKCSAITMDIIWQLTEITPGAIAGAAIFVRYALSNDESFQRQGNKSKIDYEADFNVYLKYLIVGRADNKPSVKRVFHAWNMYFFPSHTKPNLTIRDAPVHAVDDMFAALEEEDDDNINTPDDDINIDTQFNKRNHLEENEWVQDYAQNNEQCEQGDGNIAPAEKQALPIHEATALKPAPTRKS
ncbi:hypothetical protein K439DRAFT_1618789 [Ramaria rubella]|nr:hypothetical protein K439DRAFT_1618789 [Ramaria rubella]